MSQFVNNAANIGYSLFADDEVPTTPTRPIDDDGNGSDTPKTQTDSDPVSPTGDENEIDFNEPTFDRDPPMPEAQPEPQPEPQPQPQPQPRRSSTNNNEESIQKQKNDYLYELKRMEKKGIQLPQHHTIDDSLDAIKSTYERVSKDVRKDKAVNRYMTFLNITSRGLEALDQVTSVDLYMKGFNGTVNQYRDEFVDTFEDLHDKYGGQSPLSPEMNLLVVFMMALSTNVIANMFDKFAPGIGADVVRNDPSLVQNFIKSAAKQMYNSGNNNGEPQEGGGNMMEQMISQFMNQQQPQQQSQQQQSPPQQQSSQQKSSQQQPPQQKKRSESQVSTHDIEQIVRENTGDNTTKKKKSSRSISL